MRIRSISIGELIRILRNERGMSREELAELADVSCSHINKIEAGIKRPGKEAYQRIMNVLGADIVTSEGEKTEKGKCVIKAQEILMTSTEKEVKFLVGILEEIVKNLFSILINTKNIVFG